MDESLILREYRPADRDALTQVIREAWQYDRFCSPATADKLARVYLNSCLTNQTFTRVAVVDGEPVGVIMGKDIARHRCPLSLRIAWLRSVVSLLASREGRAVSKIFSGVQDIDKALLAACPEDYKGELAFFALKASCRGRGLGRKLFHTVVDYMRAQGIEAFYLFTDTSCNYPFYEHLGLTRRGAQKQRIEVKGQQGDMTFFLYDYAC